MNFSDFKNGMEGHVADDRELSDYLNHIKESIECGAFETASLYAQNLKRKLFTRYEYESMKQGESK